MKRVIISGATGAIGSALIENLLCNNVEILIISRKNSKRLSVIPKNSLISIKYCDLSEYKNLQNDTEKTYDVFYHFAWTGTFGDSRNDMYIQNKNVEYSLVAVEIAKRFGCHTFIGAGSQAEYGRVEGVLTPSTPVFPENGYGMAKLCAGQMTREYAHKLGLKHIWMRILSIYGPNDGAQTMVMSTINKLKNGEEAQFTKGEQLWDYLYSGDAAEAFRLIGERGVDGKIYILGGGVARPLYEYINIIGECLEAKELLKIGDLPYSDRQVMHLCADITELKRDTGWLPQTKFSDGIKKILNLL